MRWPLVASALTLALLFGACGGESDSADNPPATQETPATGEAETTPPGTGGEGNAGGDPSAQSSDKVTAKVIDTAFEPRDLVVKVGTTVTWKQIGDQPHSVTAVNEEFDSSPNCSPLKSDNCDFEGDTFSFTFKEAGTFDYYCRIHGLPTGRGMFATLTVEK